MTTTPDHVQCAQCGEVKPVASFRTKSTLKQAISRGFSRPYSVTSKFCSECRAKKKEAHKLKLSKSVKAQKRLLMERVSYAYTGASTEHAFPLECRLAKLEQRIIGTRKEGQHKRWRQQRASNWADQLATIKREIVRCINCARASDDAHTVLIMDEYIDLLRRARGAINADIREPRGQRGHPSNTQETTPHFLELLLSVQPSHKETMNIHASVAHIREWYDASLARGYIRKPLAILGGTVEKSSTKQ